MGLSDPLLYLESCVFVAAFETSPNAAPTQKLFDALADKPRAAVTSELTLAELIAPSRHAAMSVTVRRGIYLRLFDEGKFIGLRPITRRVLLDTASIREDHSQRMPDAIHVATAIDSGCKYFMTYDKDARRLPPSLTWLTPSTEDVDQFLAVLDA